MAEGAIVRHADAIVHDLGRSGGSLMDAKKRLNGEGSMFVNVNATPGNRPKFLGEHGSLARTQFILSEFKYSRGAEIFGESEPAEYVYQVVEGAVRSYKLLSDGRRQIGAFHLVGDIFGLENGAQHRFTAEAIVDTTVRLAKRVSLEHVAEADALVARELLTMTTSNLQHAENHMLLLGRKTSLERVAAFLLEMDRRLSSAAEVMALPMGRRDIADYLGLTLETVSRALSHLHTRGILDFLGQTQRQIVLRNRTELAKLDL
jgi:CRP/FNR family transcriptional regulator, nitrogen fixation regulation protein